MPNLHTRLTVLLFLLSLYVRRKPRPHIRARLCLNTRTHTLAKCVCGFVCIWEERQKRGCHESLIKRAVALENEVRRFRMLPPFKHPVLWWPPKEATNSAIASFAVTIRKDLIADAVWETWEYGIEPRDQWLHTRAFANEVKIAASLHLRVCLWDLDMTRNAPCKQEVL